MIDPLFFADVFATRAVEHSTHGYYQDDERNLRCAQDDELVTPSPAWLKRDLPHMSIDEPYSPSRVHWFGQPWPAEDYRAPICEDDRYRIPVPLGSECIHCGGLIDEDDRGIRYSFSIVMVDDAPAAGPPQYSHAECNLRNVMGCYAHLVGGSHDHDRPYREDARLVWEWIQTAGGLNAR